MKYHRILTDWLEIVTQFRDSGLPKEERKRRHVLISSWEKSVYDEPLPSLEEIESFWQDYGSYCHNHIFVKKVMKTPILKDIESGGVKGLHFLFQSYARDERNIYWDELLSTFCAVTDHKYSSLQLAEKLLEQEKDNECAIKFLYQWLKEYLEYSIHEVPSGILYDANGATIDNLLEMLQDVDKFERLSNRLGINNEQLINDCRILYSAYKEYLQDRTSYKNFEDYLHQQHISAHGCAEYYFPGSCK